VALACADAAHNARMRSRRLFIVGPMAAGKTTVGMRLARHLGLPFADTDAVIEARTGTRIATIFEIEGEAGFRARERDVLDELTRSPEIVLATGGGAVLLAQNRALLRERGTVIYLRTPVAEQLRRTRGTHHRPLLEHADRRERLEAMAQVRDPLYLEIADVVVDSAARRVGATVADVLARLGPDITHGTPERRTG
jgi:shikimate kinase